VEHAPEVLEGELRWHGERLPPPARGEQGAGPQRRHHQPDGRDEPEQADYRQGDVERRPPQRLPAEPGPRAGGDGHQPRSARKRRRFRIMTGNTRANRRTATAEPSPWSLAPNAVRHISKAMTLASFCTAGGAMASTMSNTLRT